MRRNIAIGFVIALCLVGSGVFEKHGSSKPGSSVIAQSNQSGKNIVKKSFEVSPAGALVKVKTAQGLEIFSARPSNEGFSLAYELYDPQKKKAPLKLPGQSNAVRVVTVTGQHLNKDIFYCAECEQVRKLQKLPPLPDNKAVTSARTRDGVLMVTSSFSYEGSKLKVYRVIQNVSADPYLQGENPVNLPEIAKQSKPVTVRLLSVQTQNDMVLTAQTPKVVLRQFSKFRDIAPNSPGSESPMGFGLLPSPLFFSRACGDCPTECEFTLNLGALERGTICIDCPGRMTAERRARYAASESTEATRDSVFVRVAETIENDCDSPITINYATTQGAANGRDFVLVPAGEKIAVSPRCGEAGRLEVRSCPISLPLTDATFCKENWQPLIIVSRDERRARPVFSPIGSSSTVSPCRGLGTSHSGALSPFQNGFVAQGKGKQRIGGMASSMRGLGSSDLEAGQGIALMIEYDLTRTKP